MIDRLKTRGGVGGGGLIKIKYLATFGLNKLNFKHQLGKMLYFLKTRRGMLKINLLVCLFVCFTWSYDKSLKVRFPCRIFL